MDPSLKVSLMGHCVICLRKVRDGDDDDGKGVEKFNVGEGDSQIFSRTFNEFWTILKAKGHQNHSGNSSETGGVAGGGGISLTTAISSVEQGETTYFSVAPTLCQLCGGKVVAVENLMKAVRQQVREVEMLLAQSREKGGRRLNEFEKHLRENGMLENVVQSTLQFVDISGQCQGQDEGQPIEDKADSDEMQVKEEDPTLSSCHWQVPVPEDFQENSKNSIPSQLTAATAVARDKSIAREEDISEFDLDYIKSEQEDDDDEEQETNADDDEEEMVDLPKRSGTEVGVSTSPDPLAIITENCKPKVLLPFPTPTTPTIQNSGGETGAVVVKQDVRKILKSELCFEETTYTSEAALLSHEIMVHGAERFRCDICGVSFHGKQAFTKHRLKHAGVVFEEEWKCEVDGCGKIFKKKGNFNAHRINMHGGDTAHVCDFCGKGFGSSLNLRTHRDSVHLGVKPWGCDECGKCFTENSHLKRHMLTVHLGERPFPCLICGQRFGLNSSLKKHMRGHEKKGADFKPKGPQMKKIRQTKKAQ